jgi:hypothetical protein
MSAAMCPRASASGTLISVSSRRRASGVRRSCEMPASITARSCSILASCCAMRLKPMLTSRISLVVVLSSSRLPQVVTLAHAARRRWTALERPVDQARDQRRAGQRQRGCHRGQPDDPGGAGQQRLSAPGRSASSSVALDGEAHPQAGLAVDAAGHHRAGPRRATSSSAMRRPSSSSRTARICRPARAGGCAPFPARSWS